MWFFNIRSFLTIVGIFLTFFQSLVHYFVDFGSEQSENILDIIKSHGYPAEEHEVTTEDGYILKLHRMPRRNSKHLPVFLMHGLSQSSVDWINVYRNNSLGYILWDAGFDVWMGNARGTVHGKGHKFINVEDNPKQFYNFSFHEIGKFDIPAMIDYILEKTNQSQIYYVGFSQGGTSFYICMSLRPEYNKKIRLASLMAPVGFVGKIPFPLFRLFYKYVDEIQSYTDEREVYSFRSDYARILGASLIRKGFYKIVRSIYYQAGNGFADDEQLPKETLELIFRTSPTDFSLRQFFHYFQCTKLERFCQYDHGPRINKDLYGSREPPDYNLTQITAPVAIYYSKNDMFNNIEDMQKAIRILPNVVRGYLVPNEKFNHIDFTLALETKRIVYDIMIDLIKQF